MTTDDMTETRLRIAQTRGLPDHMADRLKGDTEAEIAADADTLVPLFAIRTPAPDPGQGPRAMDLAYDEYEAFAAAMNPRRRTR